MKKLLLAAALMFSTGAAAHEMTPTYFRILPTQYDNIYMSTIELFNRREDADRYQFEVYTEDWVPIEFASFDRYVKIEYGQGIEAKLYFRKSDINRITYICSRSMADNITNVASLICSKIDGEK